MNELQIDPKFDVFKLNEYRDESIEQYDEREYYQPTGKNLEAFRGTKLRIQTKGDHLLNIAEGLLELDVRYNSTLAANFDERIHIVAGVNDTLYTSYYLAQNPIPANTDANGVFRQITLTAGVYNDIAALLVNVRARITASYGAAIANAGNQVELDIVGSLVRLRITGPNAAVAVDGTDNYYAIALGSGLATYLGFAEGQVGLYSEIEGIRNPLRVFGINPAETEGVTAIHDATYNNIMTLNSNPMAIFRKASLYANNIELHAIDWPNVPFFITRATQYSPDYQSKRQDLRFDLDRSPSIIQSNDLTEGDTTNFSEFLNRQLAIHPKNADGTPNIAAGANQGNSIVYNIKLKDIFPYFISNDKATRGITYTVELDINPEVQQILPRFVATYSTNLEVKIKNLSLWVPNIKASVVAEAALIEDMKANKEGMVVHYENPQVYRTLHAPTTNFTWVIDSVAKIPKRVYVGFQRAGQLDTCLGNDNPNTYQNFLMRTAELRIGSDTWPRQPYIINFEPSTLGTAQNYERLFTDFYSSGMAQELDNGGLLSMKKWGQCYPLVCFNVEREGVLQVEDQIHDVTVNFTFKDNQPTDFYATAVIVYDDSIAIRTDGLSRLKLSK